MGFRIPLLQILFLSFCFSCSLSFNPNEQESEILDQFRKFQVQFNKTYTSIEETFQRYEIFKSNLLTILEHKSSHPNSQHGITFFADMTPEEFQTTFLTMKNPNSFETSEPSINFLGERQEIDLGEDIEIPDQYDWREKGVNDTIENQGVCWSCWAFTTVTNIESLYYIKYGKKIKLSEQQLIDCDTSNEGCKGGLMTLAYDYIQSAGGLMLEKDYPYADKKQKCSFDKSKAVANIQGYVRLPRNTKEITKALLKIGPLGAGVNGRFLQFYRGGVLDSPECTGDLTHAIVIVGYGVEETKEGKQEYWICKNEWGSFWGENGYFRIRKTEGIGMCGINMYVSTALIGEGNFVKE